MKTATRNIKEDYLAGVESLRPFYQYPLEHPDPRQIIADKPQPAIERSLLADIIREQYGELALTPEVERNLDRLAQPTSYSVTTGHQLVLLGGPLFTVYKVMSAIRLAEKWSSQLGEETPVVPVFWIHTEDHDFEEINHFYASFDEKQRYPGAFQGPVGWHQLGEAISPLIPDHFSAKLREAYAPGRSMAMAFRAFMHELFGRFGLLILDAADARLKAAFTNVAGEEFQRFTAFKQVNQHSAALEAAGYPLQIHPREVNLFYMDATGRDRIIPENGHFRIDNREQTMELEDLMAVAQDQPEKLSPNVSLRPLYQEMILPNLAYFGGWGELSYWMQLKGVFDHFGVNFPALLPRFSATLFTPEQAEAWQSKGFALEDIRQSLPMLNRQYMPQVWDDNDFQAQATAILGEVKKLHAYIGSEISETLARSGDALHTKTERFLQTLLKKAQRVKRHDHREPFEEIAALKQAIQPDGTVQERVLSLASFPAYQPEQLLDVIYEACDPLNFGHRFLVLPKAT
ncbi:MAG: bacillithiol biosynthesis BshC [Bacteroidota bacterium]